MSPVCNHASIKQPANTLRVLHPIQVASAPVAVSRELCHGLTGRRHCGTQHRHQRSLRQGKIRSIALRDDGGDNPLLSAWKAKAFNEPGFLSEPEDASSSEDPLDEEAWDPATQQEWTEFLQQSRLKDCQWWDPAHVDPGFPILHVDLERE